MRDFPETDASTPGNDAIDISRVSLLAKAASTLGYDIVEIAGFVDLIDAKSAAQKPILDEARKGADNIAAANSTVKTAIEAITASCERSLEKVEESVDIVQKSGARTQSVATWVQALDARMCQVSDTLQEVKNNNGAITSIASQVNILAINAKIEAARAGNAGRGFAVVAEAVNELSQKTTQAATAILDSVTSLSEWIETLRQEAENVASEATGVISEGHQTDQALTAIAENVRATNCEAKEVTSQAEAVERAGKEFSHYFDRIESAITETAAGIHQAHQQVNTLIDQSETIVQHTVSLGGGSDDAHFIQFVQEQAAKISQIFENAIQTGAIKRSELFNFTYTPIPNTNPQQFSAAFLQLTDSMVSPVLERALEFDPKIVFCAAVTKHGYLPTHNRKFSRPQRPNDPEWNAGNSRNRRMFDDRVGLKAGRNREPFLLQIYRRDMGGGTFKMMKDLSAPITVDNTAWGGLRMGIGF